MSTLVQFGAAAIAAVSLAACGSDKTDPAKDTGSAAPGTGASAATSAAMATSAPAATSAAPAMSAPPATSAAAATSATAAATAGPNGRSAIPTTEEWASGKEVGVKGSTKLNCDTKMVREWLRVSCVGKNDTGGQPTTVSIKKGGGRGDTFTLASNHVTSLVCPYVDGIDIVADFAWTDTKKELHVSWPHGAPMPPIKGEFH